MLVVLAVASATKRGVGIGLFGGDNWLPVSWGWLKGPIVPGGTQEDCHHQMEV